MLCWLSNIYIPFSLGKQKDWQGYSCFSISLHTKKYPHYGSPVTGRRASALRQMMCLTLMILSGGPHYP